MTERPKDACTGCYSEPCVCDALAESVGAGGETGTHSEGSQPTERQSAQPSRAAPVPSPSAERERIARECAAAFNNAAGPTTFDDWCIVADYVLGLLAASRAREAMLREAAGDVLGAFPEIAGSMGGLHLADALAEPPQEKP